MLVIGAILISTNVIDTGDTKTVVRQVEPTQPTGDTTGSEGRSVRDIYAQEGRGVAFITSNGVTSDSNSPFGLPQQGTATGSGFAINKDGYIVTNAHVVEGAKSVEVSFDENGGDSIPAEVKGVDTSADIAVLKVNPDDVKGGIKTIPLGDSSNLQVGDPVIAIGNPFGYTRTVTTGIVSGLQRQIQAPNGFTIGHVIQTDASINPGNSGGPLLDANGRVIGINSQIATGGGQGSVGIGFAVPINTAKKLLPDLQAGETIERAYLGVQMQGVTSQLADDLNLPADHGALDRERHARQPRGQGGPARRPHPDHSGRHRGRRPDRRDRRQGMQDENSVADAVAGHKPGDKVDIEYYRGNDKKTVSVELTKRPANADSSGSGDQGGNGGGNGILP